ncbi:hypothetical protein J5N97_002750 [Dioscorea zingiberensis]|uniref:Mediator of RNA polymerase II transcription subunit 11 n=1 Tax=Dioscorea zingiberensis TaxID=325984 RepID=A0A9D5HPP9_9LILI|nr:hypothetical protein J5N97_002750 [Dioscorea zingiberensis]
MGPQNQNTSLQRLHLVEKRIVRVLELAGLVMDELANSTGPRTDAVTSHCREFMQSIRDIQVTLRDEIKSASSNNVKMEIEKLLLNRTF